MVILIHVQSIYRVPLSAITACAVPVFFVISGYLLYDNNLLQKLKKNLKRILIITIWSTIIYAVLYLYKSTNHPTLNAFTIESLRRFIIYNENPFIYHLWYLNAYIYVLIIMITATYLRCQGLLFWLIPIILASDIILGRYSGFIFGTDYGLKYIFGWLHVGIPYFLTGCLLRMKKIIIKKKRYNILGIILFSISSYIEYTFIESGGDKYISTYFLTVLIFLFFMSINIYESNIFAIIGKRDSLYIYIFHPIIIDVMTFVDSKIGMSHYNTYLYVSPLLVFCFTELLIVSFRTIYKIFNYSIIRNRNNIIVF